MYASKHFQQGARFGSTAGPHLADCGRTLRTLKRCPWSCNRASALRGGSPSQTRIRQCGPGTSGFEMSTPLARKTDARCLANSWLGPSLVIETVHCSLEASRSSACWPSAIAAERNLESGRSQSRASQIAPWAASDFNSWVGLISGARELICRSAPCQVRDPSRLWSAAKRPGESVMMITGG